MKRLHQSWPARNRFQCGGRLITGPDRLYFYLALSFIVVPFIITCGFTWPYLFVRLGWYVVIAPLVGYILLGLASITFMLLTRYRDPGIIPRGLEFSHNPDNPWDYERKKPPETIKINVHGENLRIKYCDTCHIYRPPRAIHCSVCNNCVDRFDHHCPWIGNCVGRRNYQTFFAFVWCTILSCIYVLCISIVHLVFIIMDEVDNQTGVDIFTHLLKYGGWYSGLMVPYCLLALGLVGFLGTFHCTLVSAGQTTNEKLKGLYKKKKNPHSKGLIGNWLSIICAPRVPSNFDFRSFVDEAEQKKCRRKGWPQRKRKDTGGEERKSKRKRQTTSAKEKAKENGDFELEQMEGGRGKSATSSDRHSSGDGKKSKGKEVRKEGEENGNGHP